MKHWIHGMSAAALLAVAIFLTAPGSRRILARKTADYLEGGATDRAIAALAAELGAQGEQGGLDLVISAVGPHVDPPPGFEGIRGANRITAREIDEIARGRSMSVVTTDGSGTARPGSFRPGRTGRIPVRRLERGQIVWRGLSERDYVLELLVTSGGLPPGAHVTEIRVDGRPRLRVHFVLGPTRGRILDLESLDDHPLREVQR